MRLMLCSPPDLPANDLDLVLFFLLCEEARLPGCEMKTLGEAVTVGAICYCFEPTDDDDDDDGGGGGGGGGVW